MRKVIFFLVLLFLPISVFASCGSSELSRYKILSSHINYYYEFNGSSFDVTFYNVSNQLKIINRSNNSSFVSSSDIGDVLISGVSPGSIITFGVYPSSGECSNYMTYTYYVNLPFLNSYYGDPICNNNDNVLCSKFVNTSMYSYDQFVSKVKESVKEEVIEDKPQNVVKEYSFFQFLIDYYIYILLFVIIVGSISIYYLNKKNSFDL